MLCPKALETLWRGAWGSSPIAGYRIIGSNPIGSAQDGLAPIDDEVAEWYHSTGLPEVQAPQPGRSMRFARHATLALTTAILVLAAQECLAAPWRLAVDIGGYQLPEDEFRLLPDGIFVDHLAAGVSVETYWLFSWRLALDVSRYDQEPQPVTTYADPYGSSGLTFTPRMYSYVWSLQIGFRGPGRVWSPFVLVGPAYVAQRYEWDSQQSVEAYATWGLAGIFGLDVHPLSAERRLFVGLGGRFHATPVVEDEALMGRTVFNAARKGLGWLVRLGFEF